MGNRYLQSAQRATGTVESAVRKAAMPLRNYGFPYRSPNVPRGIAVPTEPPMLCADYDTQ